uniref:Putative rna-directed dna polymerase from mobile element jockey-like isoform x3 n=1 Tax=Lutzomyia longipalpis TaxID=7200 RepID=A0A1B0CU15_LUTLO
MLNRCGLPIRESTQYLEWRKPIEMILPINVMSFSSTNLYHRGCTINCKSVLDYVWRGESCSVFPAFSSSPVIRRFDSSLSLARLSRVFAIFFNLLAVSCISSARLLRSFLRSPNEGYFRLPPAGATIVNRWASITAPTGANIFMAARNYDGTAQFNEISVPQFYAGYFTLDRRDAQARKLFRKKKSEHWRERCENFSSSTSLSELWNMARSFRGQSRSRNTNMNESMFQNFADKLAPPFVSRPYHIAPTAPEGRESHLQYWSLFTMSELKSALSSTKNKSAGLDKIKVSFLKNLPMNGLEVLIGIFNDFMSSAIIPSPWLSAKVIAIRKPNKDGSEVTHFRPICILSAVRKVFEKLILLRLDSWVTDLDLIPQSQMGFRRGFGTQNCLAELSAEIQIAWSAKKVLGCVFLDVSSAYDGVLVDVLCRDLVSVGLPQNIGVLLSRLLSERCLEFFDGSRRILSRSGSVGLPQGSVLAPLCYNLYVRDIDNTISRDCLVLQYADDVAIGFAHKDPQVIANVRCGSNVIPLVEKFRYLGVVFDRKCLWGAHIRAVAESCSKRVNFLRAVCGLRWGAHPSVLRTLYVTTIRSVMEYGSLVFRTAANSHMMKLYRIQWRSLRICLGLMTSTHTGSLEVVAGICPLDLRFIVVAQRFLIRSSDRHVKLWQNLRHIKQNCPKSPFTELLKWLDEIGWNEINVQAYDNLYFSTDRPQFQFSTIIWEQLRGFPKRVANLCKWICQKCAVVTQ